MFRELRVSSGCFGIQISICEWALDSPMLLRICPPQLSQPARHTCFLVNGARTGQQCNPKPDNVGFAVAALPVRETLSETMRAGRVGRPSCPPHMSTSRSFARPNPSLVCFLATFASHSRRQILAGFRPIDLSGWAEGLSENGHRRAQK